MVIKLKARSTEARVERANGMNWNPFHANDASPGILSAAVMSCLIGRKSSVGQLRRTATLRYPERLVIQHMLTDR